MHGLRFVTLDEVRRPPAATQELIEIIVIDACKDCRIADLEAVEVQDREDDAVGDWVEELVGMPSGRERAGLGLAVPDNASHDQAGIVERGAEGVAERIAELAALVDRAGGCRRDVARNAAGERELGEELLHPRLVPADVGVYLAVAPFEIGVRHQRRAAMAGSGDIEHVEIVRLDDPVQVDVDEVLAWRRAPMPDNERLDVRQRQRLTEERIVVKIDLPDRQIVCCAPIGIDEVQLGGRYCMRFRSTGRERRDRAALRILS